MTIRLSAGTSRLAEAASRAAWVTLSGGCSCPWAAAATGAARISSRAVNACSARTGLVCLHWGEIGRNGRVRGLGWVTRHGCRIDGQGRERIGRGHIRDLRAVEPGKAAVAELELICRALRGHDLDGYAGWGRASRVAAAVRCQRQVGVWNDPERWRLAEHGQGDRLRRLGDQSPAGVE